MERTYISDLKDLIGKEVRIRGRVDTIRDQGKIIFVVLRDRTGKVQTVAWHQDNEVFATIKSITNESVLDIIGDVKKAPQVKNGFEVAVKEVTVDSLAKAPLPIAIEEPHTSNVSALEKRLDYRWIDLRSDKNQLMMKICTTLLDSFRFYCLKSKLIEIHAPSILCTASESGASVFELKYFERKAYLAQSPQFHKQMGIAADLEGVFNVGPVFRAEKSFTTRHLTEYISLDIELGYIDSYLDVCRFEQELIKYMLSQIKEDYSAEIEKEFGVEVEVPKGDFPIITVEEAKEKLSKIGIESKSDGDFSPEEELQLGEIIKNETDSQFFFMVEYPHYKRAFYHMKDPKDNSKALGYDLFWNGIEITTGAQREHRVEELRKNARERGMEHESLNEYFEYFEYGCPPHGGFGMGMERFMMELLNLKSVQEAAYLPNTPNRIGRRLSN